MDFYEAMSYFNRKVSKMDIEHKYKVELLGLIIALGNAHEKEMPHWIPCSERLPEDKKYVLVTDYGETDIGRRFGGRWLDYYGDKLKDVTAWMPLPEPYREGE